MVIIISILNIYNSLFTALNVQLHNRMLIENMDSTVKSQNMEIF